ncbi:MAG: hypothetical protein QXI54_00085 [Archaeoglobaceae archaeon]
MLNEIRKQDETSWIWNKAKLELSYLSRVVERNLAEFNAFSSKCSPLNFLGFRRIMLKN